MYVTLEERDTSEYRSTVPLSRILTLLRTVRLGSISTLQSLEPLLIMFS